MNIPHETWQGDIRAGYAAALKAKALGILTDTTIAALTSTGTIAKLLAKYDAQVASVLILHEADQVRAASLARHDLLRVLTGYGSPIITNADVETGRAAGSGNFEALFGPLRNLMTPTPRELESAGNQ